MVAGIGLCRKPLRELPPWLRPPPRAPRGGFKLVRGVADELFDLTADPRELRDAASADPRA